MLKLLANAFYLMPAALRDPLKKNLKPLIDLVKRTALILGDLWTPVYEIRRDGKTAIFIGHDSVVPYLTKLIFGEVLSGRHVKTVFIFQVKREIRSAGRQAALVFVNLSGWFSRGWIESRTLQIPQFILQMCDVPDGEVYPSIKNRTNRYDLLRIKKNQYTYEITRDERKLVFFYEHCHRPFIEERHGDMSYVNPFHEFKRYFESGELLLVRHGDQIVAGSLCQIQDGVYHTLYNGLYHADPDLLKEGALAAQYLFAIVEAQKRGCRRVCFGRSRPFLKDGVLNYKKKWRTRLVPDPEIMRELRMQLGVEGPESLAFLEDNPLIVRERGELIGVVFLGARALPEIDQTLSLLKQFSHDGMAAMTVYLLDPRWSSHVDEIRQLNDHLPHPVRVVDLSRREPDRLNALVKRHLASS